MMGQMGMGKGKGGGGGGMPGMPGGGQMPDMSQLQNLAQLQKGMPPGMGGKGKGGMRIRKK